MYPLPPSAPSPVYGGRTGWGFNNNVNLNANQLKQ